MVVLEFGGHRRELTPGIGSLSTFGQLDKRDDVGIEPELTSLPLQDRASMSRRSSGRNQLPERRLQLRDTNNRVLVLPSPIFEFGL